MGRPIVVMGPSGCGKSTLARALAQALGRSFIEGDELHPPANRAKMARGEPLTDEDRLPFLDAVANAMTSGQVPVASCSALRRVYRNRLLARVPDALFIHPRVDRNELARRMARRRAHFMPASLLDNQLATLEELAPDEPGITLDGCLQLRELVTAVEDALSSRR